MLEYFYILSGIGLNDINGIVKWGWVMISGLILYSSYMFGVFYRNSVGDGFQIYFMVCIDEVGMENDVINIILN